MKKKLFGSLILFLILPLCSCGGKKCKITWQNYDGKVLEVDRSVPIGTMPSYDGETPTRDSDDKFSYRFEGKWSPEVELATKDQVYTAVFEQYVGNIEIILDLNGGHSNFDTSPRYVTSIDASSFVFDVKKAGYNFRGWEYNGEKVFDQTGQYLLDRNLETRNKMIFKAIFAQDAFLILKTNFEEGCTLVGSGYYAYNTNVTISVIPNGNYTFLGWYSDEILLSTSYEYNLTMWNDDVVIEAIFQLPSYKLTVEAFQSELGSVMIKDGDNSTEYLQINTASIAYKSQITVAAFTKTNKRFLGWFDEDDKLVETNAAYTFIMLNKDCNLFAKWEADCYELSIDVTHPKGGEVTGAKTYMYGDLVKLTATVENDAYQFNGWSNEGKHSDNLEYSFRMPNHKLAVTADISPIEYEITYNLNGGTNNPYNPKTYNIETPTIDIVSPTHEHGKFVKWVDENGTKVYQIKQGSFGDITLNAVWELDKHEVVVISADGNKGTVSGGGTFDYGSSITITATPNPGYVFDGWYQSNNKVSTLESYTFSLSKNETFEARWKLAEYKITYILNGGKNSNLNPTTYTINSPTIILNNATHEHGAFIKWIDNSGSQITQINQGSFGDITLTAIWNLETYDILVISSNADRGTVSGGGTYDYGSSVTITATPNPGYAFDGWYQSDKKVSDQSEYLFTILAENQSFEARWIIVEYKITYILNGGTNDLSNPVTYTVETPTFVLSDPTYNFRTFVKWVDENNNQVTQIKKGTTRDISLTAIWKQTAEQKTEEEEENRRIHFVNPTVSQDGKSVQYGMYPQSNIADSSLISILNSKAGTLPTSSNSQNWTAYNYYFNSSNSIKFMWYIDIDDNLDGYNDYRGVYFTSYRPDLPFDKSSASNSLQDDNGYYTYNVYWFKYEPITWRILQKSASDYLLMSNKILDSQPFTMTDSEQKQIRTDYQGNTASVYPNNYKYSDLRAFLNVDFYDNAFKTSDVSSIKVTTVDNTASTTGHSSNEYACENTNDKLFALSYDDIINSSYGFSSSATTKDEAKMIRNSEYAKCMGCINIDNYGCWWLRSPSCYSSSAAPFIGVYNCVEEISIESTAVGIVPALHVSI